MRVIESSKKLVLLVLFSLMISSMFIIPNDVTLYFDNQGLTFENNLNDTTSIKSLDFSIDFAYPEIDTFDNSVSISIDGCQQTSTPGFPILPIKRMKISLPYDGVLESISLTKTFNHTLSLPMQLEIAANPVASSSASHDDLNKQQELGTIETESSSLIQIASIQRHKGEQFALVDLFPVEYLSAQHVIFHSRIEFTINYSQSSEYGINDKHMLSEDSPVIDYLIITRSKFLTSLAPLVERKEFLGLTVMNITLEEIDLSYTGRDLAEKMRNCVIDFYNTSSIEWLLLVGDVDPLTPSSLDTDWELPSRLVYNPDGSYTTYTLTDYYFASLDGNWDSDFDNIFGESRLYSIEDEVDWFPEVYVGRFPVRETTELDAIVSKIINYEASNLSFLNLGAVLNYAEEPGFFGAATDCADLKDFICDNYSPTNDNTKLYERFGNLTGENVIFEINSNNYTLINWAGHGSTQKFARKYSLGDLDENGILDLDEIAWADALNTTGAYNLNNQIPHLLFSASCETGAFDLNGLDSIGEALLKNPNGGAICFAGATRTSWYGIGRIDSFTNLHDMLFWNEFFQKGAKQPGKALYNSKLEYILRGSNLDDEFHRNTLLTYQLLGDPHIVVGGINVELAANETVARGTPGDSFEFTFTIQNTGEIQDIFSLNCDLPIGWTVTFQNSFHIPIDNVTLASGEKVLLHVNIVSSITGIGSQSLQIEAVSISNPVVWASLSIWILSSYDILLDCANNRQNLDYGGEVTFDVNCTNTGMLTENFEFAPENTVSDSWSMTINPQNATLSPGESIFLSVTVSVIGTPVRNEIQIEVQAKSVNDPLLLKSINLYPSISNIILKHEEIWSWDTFDLKSLRCIDIDSDEDLELVQISSTYIRILSGSDGSLERELRFGPDTFYYSYLSSIADIDGDDILEIVVLMMDSADFGYRKKLQVLNGCTLDVENELFGMSIDVEPGYLCTGDVDNDGASEILHLDYYGTLHILDGTTLTEIASLNGPFKRLDDTSVIDVDSDDENEIVLLKERNVTILNAVTLLTEWESPAYDYTTYTYDGSPILIGDLDDDSDIEILVAEGQSGSIFQQYIHIYDGTTHIEEAVITDIIGRFVDMEIGDIDNDTISELVISFSNSSDYYYKESPDYISSYDGQTLSQEWLEVYISRGEGTFGFDLTLGDRDNDDIIEIIGGHFGGHWGLGEILSIDGITKQPDLILSERSPICAIACGDIDNDATGEIVVGDDAGYIRVFNSQTGQLEWTSDDLGGEAYEIEISDVDNDGSIEFVVGMHCNLSTCHIDGYVAIFDGITKELEWTSDILGNSAHSIEIADIEGDGCKEIIVVVSEDNPDRLKTRLYVFNGSSRDLIWTKSDVGRTESSARLGLVTYDWDDDDILDIVVGDFDGFIRIFDGINGQLKYEKKITSSPFLRIELSDLDNDNCPEFILPTFSGLTYILAIPELEIKNIINSGASQEWLAGGFPIALSDLDRDGIIELVRGNTIVSTISGRIEHYLTAYPWTELYPRIFALSQYDIDNDTYDEIIIADYTGLYILNIQTTPLLSILLPQNTTYATDNISVHLYMTEPASWIAYSLDGNDNITVFTNEFIISIEDGSHLLVVYANSTEGVMVCSESVWFSVDTTSPSVITWREPTYPNELDVVSIFASISDYSGVSDVILSYSINNGIIWVNSSMTIILENWLGLISTHPVGTIVSYCIIASDPYGNCMQTGIEFYIVQNSDISAPSIDLISLNPEFPMDNETVSITANVTDSSGVQEVILSYSIDDCSTWSNITMSPITDLWTASIPTHAYGTKVYYKILACDSIGHWAISGLEFYLVQSSDTIEPSFVNISHTPLSPMDNESVIISANITDLNGVPEAILSYSTDSGSIWSNITMSLVEGLWVGTIPIQDEGITVYYKIFACDSIGNWVESDLSYYMVGTSDISGPFIGAVIRNPISPTDIDDITISVSISDPNGVIDVILSYSTDNCVTWANITMNLIEGQWTCVISHQDVGIVIHYKIIATDNFDNWSETEIENFAVSSSDIEGPSLEIYQNPHIPIESQDVVVSVDVSDPSGIFEVILSYTLDDGIHWQNVSMVYNGTYWVATIPGQSVSTSVQFCIYAQDILGNWAASEISSYLVQSLEPITVTSTTTSGTSTSPSTTDNGTDTTSISQSTNLPLELVFAGAIGAVVLVLLIAIRRKDSS